MFIYTPAGNIASMLELVDRWFLSNHDLKSYGFNSHYLYVCYVLIGVIYIREEEIILHKTITYLYINRNGLTRTSSARLWRSACYH